LLTIPDTITENCKYIVQKEDERLHLCVYRSAIDILNKRFDEYFLGPIWVQGYQAGPLRPYVVSPGRLGGDMPVAAARAHRPRPSLAIIAVAPASGGGGGGGQRWCQKRLRSLPLLPYPTSLSTHLHLRFPCCRLLRRGPKKVPYCISIV
jgi:hypothetical protein